ncbi:MAG: NAD(P)H-hydrate dehydratase [Atribacterota bacterium]|nr:NAD(P)H-hydrate dehydratase [Atribacterota bacterium]
MKLTFVREMQNMDQEAINKYGFTEDILMENAGLAAYQVIAENFKIKNTSFSIFCGTGNNGGDGLVLARKLHSCGAKVCLFIINDPLKYRRAALKNWEIVKKLQIPVFTKIVLETAKANINPNSIIVDAMFGTGLQKDIEGIYYQIISFINHHHKQPVISIDIPSGINGDNGQIMGIAIKADHTITFGLPKIGNLLYPGFSYCGKLHISHISFPPALYNKEELKIELNTPSPLPARPVNGHKGTFGKTLFISGARNYLGAPVFSSLSFLKCGGGYSLLAAPSSIVPYIGTQAKEVVYLPQKETNSGTIALENYDELLKRSAESNMVVLGPGLSVEHETRQLIKKLIIDIEKPLLLDGDALTVLSENINILNNRISPTILTPHIGEMSRLLKKSTDEIKVEAVNFMQDFTQKHNCFAVLKGAHSLICTPEGKVFLNLTGNNGMATAGSGDVLTGIIAAVFSLGLPLESAVREAVLIHGFAGDLAARKKGEDGMIASDIMNCLPVAMQIFRQIQLSKDTFLDGKINVF